MFYLRSDPRKIQSWSKITPISIDDSISTRLALLIYTSNIERMTYRRVFPRADNGMAQVLRERDVNPATDVKSIIVKLKRKSRTRLHTLTHVHK